MYFKYFFYFIIFVWKEAKQTDILVKKKKANSKTQTVFTGQSGLFPFCHNRIRAGQKQRQTIFPLFWHLHFKHDRAERENEMYGVTVIDELKCSLNSVPHPMA